MICSETSGCDTPQLPSHIESSPTQSCLDHNYSASTSKKCSSLSASICENESVCDTPHLSSHTDSCPTVSYLDHNFFSSNNVISNEQTVVTSENDFTGLGHKRKKKERQPLTPKKLKTNIRFTSKVASVKRIVLKKKQYKIFKYVPSNSCIPTTNNDQQAFIAELNARLVGSDTQLIHLESQQEELKTNKNDEKTEIADVNDVQLHKQHEKSNVSN